MTKKLKATLTMGIKGQWCLWKKGTAVWAHRTGRGEYFISRVRPVGRGELPCLNKMGGVPRYLLKMTKATA